MVRIVRAERSEPIHEMLVHCVASTVDSDVRTTTGIVNLHVPVYYVGTIAPPRAANEHA